MQGDARKPGRKEIMGKKRNLMWKSKNNYSSFPRKKEENGNGDMATKGSNQVYLFVKNGPES